MNLIEFSADDLKNLCGVSSESADATFSGAQKTIRFQTLGGAEIESIFSEITRSIDRGGMRVSGDDDSTVWEKGWGEVLKAVERGKLDIDALRPQYYKATGKEAIFRINGTYCHPITSDCEYRIGLLVREAIFREYLGSDHPIVEVGCGTGVNLVLLKRLFPDRQLVGLDWAASAVEIVETIFDTRDPAVSVRAERFNMLAPDTTPVNVEDMKGVLLTVHAMEQLGSNWLAFLEFLQAARPAYCVHIEPLFELYEDDDEFDTIAKRYHRSRNYLQGFLPQLQKLERNGELEILSLRRVLFGNRYHEAYSVLVWRPVY